MHSSVPNAKNNYIQNNKAKNTTKPTQLSDSLSNGPALPKANKTKQPHIEKPNTKTATQNTHKTINPQTFFLEMPLPVPIVLQLIGFLSFFLVCLWLFWFYQGVFPKSISDAWVLL